VAEVKECAGIKPAKETTGDLSIRQQKFLSDLLSQFGLELEAELTPETIGFRWGQPIISALVDARRMKATGKSYTFPPGTRLLSHPDKGKPRERMPTFPPLRPQPKVPDGHYAIPSLTGNNDFDFYRVEMNTTGPWAGRISVSTIIGGHPQYYVRGAGKVVQVLDAIVEFGIEEAGLLFGQKLKHCRYCNRDLTKYASRILSAGRHCCSKHGKAEEWDAIQALRPEGEE
jgi:hypothetical protein